MSKHIVVKTCIMYKYDKLSTSRDRAHLPRLAKHPFLAHLLFCIQLEIGGVNYNNIILLINHRMISMNLLHSPELLSKCTIFPHLSFYTNIIL